MFVFYLWKDKKKNDTLSSLMKVIHKDLIGIKMIDESGEVYINEGLPGQKSAVVLAFILNSGENPLIIDQQLRCSRPSANLCKERSRDNEAEPDEPV